MEWKLTVPETTRLCTCPQCPSWMDCGEKTGYCHHSIATSKCIAREKGCVCSLCPVAKAVGLGHKYYCMRGSEEKQAKK